MTVLQLTPGLPPVFGPYGSVPSGARYSIATSGTGTAPYPDRLGICVHLVNYTNVGGTAESFHRNHFVPKGDKVSSTGSIYGTGYHVVVGGAGDTVVVLDEFAAPNSAGSPSNRRFVHVVLMIGDWSRQDARHERTIEALAQLCATLCTGFGIPVRWHHVHTEPNATKRLAAAMHLTNETRAKVGIFGHRDITASYTTLMRAGYTAKAAPWKNTHGDPGAFPPEQLIARIEQILQGDDMPRIVNVFDDATWTQVSPEAFVMSGPSLEWVQSLEQLAALTTLGAAKMDPNTGKPYGIWRSQLKNFHRTGAVWAGSPFAATEFLPAA